MSTALGKVCNACGVERKKKTILYDPTDFMPYCENPFICNEKHPNAPKNLIARGEELKLIPLAEATVKFGDWVAMSHPDPETANRIRRMVTQPITVRIGDPGLAQFILDFQEEYKFETVSETIRYCIQKMRESRNGFYADHAKLVEEKKEVERVVETQKEVEQALTQPEKPKEKPDDEEIVL